VQALTQYLKTMVERTVEEFARNPLSPRLAYIACVVTYHTIDRVTYGKSQKEEAAIKKEWRKLSPAFAMVEVMALDLKHVKSKHHRPVPNRIPVGFALLGSMGFNTHTFNDTGRNDALRNISFLVQDAVKFLHKQAELIDPQEPDARK
jgi:hypothetical protein